MREYYVYEDSCISCVGSFRIQDSDQVPILDAKGECNFTIDDLAILDSRGYEIARVQQDWCWSCNNYSIYRENTKIGSIYRAFTWCCEMLHLHSGRGHYVFRGSCGGRYVVERDGRLVAIITRLSYQDVICNRQILVQMNQDEDEILLLGATIALCRITRVSANNDG